MHGLYTHRKYVCLKGADAIISTPSSYWKQVTDANFKDIAPSIPQVTPGKYYIMLFIYIILLTIKWWLGISQLLKVKVALNEMLPWLLMAIMHCVASWGVMLSLVTSV